jgi:hypothetical protein
MTQAEGRYSVPAYAGTETRRKEDEEIISVNLRKMARRFTLTS